MLFVLKLCMLNLLFVKGGLEIIAFGGGVFSV